MKIQDSRPLGQRLTALMELEKILTILEIGGKQSSAHGMCVNSTIIAKKVILSKWTKIAISGILSILPINKVNTAQLISSLACR